MDTRWLKDLPAETQSEVRQNYKESIVMRKQLAKILQEAVDKSNNTSRSKLSYDNPNWAYLQADQRGYERALCEIIELILK